VISYRLFPPASQRETDRYRSEAMTHGKEHGRVVLRRLQASTRIVPFLTRWPGLEQVLRLERTTKRDGQTTTEVQYAITSLSRLQADATELLALWRNHWTIENGLHWVRDTVWQEDHCRVKNPTAGHNLACVRNSAINLLRLAKVTNLTAAIRENAYRVDRLFARLGIMKL
jgi:predicted transposase YbfD/YdcC